MLEDLADGAWLADGPSAGAAVCLSFGVHGNERAPIDAGLRLCAEFAAGARRLARGRLLLLHANPRASAANERWSAGGIDLNRCFHAEALARTPPRFEEERAARIAGWLEQLEIRHLVDFHCTVEPGSRFLMHHPPVADPDHRRIAALLEAEVELADPELYFGGVSLDEWMSTRRRTGICYETGWKDDPANTPEAVHREMLNVLRGLQLLQDAPARRFASKRLLELAGTVDCREPGFRWADGLGVNLQEVPAGTTLGRYASGSQETLAEGAALIFPKKKPELVQLGKPLVYLARRCR